MATLALALFAFDAPLIFVSQNARPYALALCFSLLSVCCFLLILKKDTTPRRIAYVLTTSAVLYAHFVFVPLILFQVVYLYAAHGKRGLFQRRWILTFLSIAGLLLPLGTQILDLLDRRKELDWIPSLSSEKGLAAEQPFGFIPPWVVFAVVVGIVSIYYWRRRERSDQRERVPITFLLSWLFVPIICLALSPLVLGVTLLKLRYLLFAHPAAIYLVAWLIAILSPTALTKRTMLYFVLGVALMLFLTPNLKKFGTFSNWTDSERWMDVAQAVKRSVRANELVILRTGFIEADQLRRPEYARQLTGYHAWPLLAYFPENHFRTAGLPFNLSRENQSYWDDLIRKARMESTLWVVGTGTMTRTFAEDLLSRTEFEVMNYYFFGRIDVFHLRKRSDMTMSKRE